MPLEYKVVMLFICILLFFGVSIWGLVKLGARERRRHQWRNKKSGNVYFVQAMGINATNAQNGQIMVRYMLVGTREPEFYREREEFLQKFEKVEE